jgi:uncharacterized delta-60 repeat protein
MRDRTRAGWRTPVQFLAGMALAAALQAADGDLDPEFSGDGRKLLDFDTSTCFADAVVPAPLGRILVAGRTGEGTWVLSRLEEDGDQNPAWLIDFEPIDFEPDGFQYSQPILDLGLDTAGRVWVAGAVTNSIAFVPQRPALVRLLENGAPDPTFDGDGRRTIAPPAGWSVRLVLDAQTLPGGGAVFAGSCETCTATGDDGLFVLRTTPAGTPDPAFAGDGWFAYDQEILSGDRASAVAVHESGAVTFAAWGVNGGGGVTFFVARLTATGFLDSTFGGGDGLSNLLTTSPRVPVELALDPDRGRIFLALANSTGSNSHAWIEVLDWAGAVELGWGTNGGLNLDLEEGTRLDAVAVQGDGKAVVVGTIDANGNQRAGFFLARTTLDGDLDDTFDNNGVKRVEFDRMPDAVDEGRAAAFWGGRLFAAGVAMDENGDGEFALLRTRNSLIFANGFERGSAGGWVED